MADKTIDPIAAADFQRVANKANLIHHDLHALLHGARLMSQQFEADTVELQSLLHMAACKAVELQMLFAPFTTRLIEVPASTLNPMGRA